MTGYPPPRRRRLGDLSSVWTVGAAALGAVFAAQFSAIVVMILLGLIFGRSSPIFGGSGASFIAVVAVFVLGGCAVVGFMCGRWWAFAGAVFVLPLLALEMALAGGGVFAFVLYLAGSCGAVALALLAGSAARQRHDRRQTRDT